MPPNGTRTRPHPLQPLSNVEILQARDIILEKHGDDAHLFFRSVYLEEPARADLARFLIAEHGEHETAEAALEASFPRLVKSIYDVIKGPGVHQLTDTIVDIHSGKIVHDEEHPPNCQSFYTMPEFAAFQDACVSSDMFKEALREFELPSNFTITIDPWPYGGLSPDVDIPRYMQGLVFARDASEDNLDSNHYSFPLPIIPVMDVVYKKLVQIDRLATGGRGDPLEPPAPTSTPKKLFSNHKPAEYVPELLDRPLRTDLKPINVVQPEGASFTVRNSSLVEWQRWRFRLGFTPREGAVLHDLCYDNRPILFRLSFSEMTVPYGDPRPPFHRKQAFDFGDGGCGRAANNLSLGCDCLGAIHYFDAWVTDTAGNPMLAKNVVCLHEQDNGIGWKHTNFRTDRAVVTRLRELVVQFIVTLANYEYVFAYKLDTAGGITVETRATGIVSVVAIDEGKTSGYGNVVSPSVLAQNHQHIFAVRMDPAIDSYDPGETNIILEETHSVPMNPETNPHGNGYEIRRDPITRAVFADAEPKLNRTVKLESKSKKNEISGKNVGYKFIPSPTQLMLADPESVQAKRAPFASHHLWITGHRDGELWAAGEFTNQSQSEVGGVKAMVDRGDWFVEHDNSNGATQTNGHHAAEEARLSSPVVWNVFGLTHNPRVEDWPVMPVEIHQVHIRPADFFTSSPALDVPSTKNATSVSVSCCGKETTQEETKVNGAASKDDTQEDPVAHLQGPGPDIDPKAVGSTNENGNRSGKQKRRLSTTLTNLLGLRRG
ncbi:copper amine oxidase [Xylariales sp. AK1849]|nr:copper amine oxidase [Xylariales sp. AK1849]